MGDTTRQKIVHNATTAAASKASKKLTDLNEDCVLHILKYLQLRDQISLASASYSFEAAFKSHTKIYNKRIDTAQLELLSPSYIKKLFLLAGKNIQQFTYVNAWNYNYNRNIIHSFLQNKCPNLQTFRLENETRYKIDLHKILSNKLQLTHLIFMFESINDDCIHAIKTLPALEHLTIGHCFYFKGNFLYLLPHLKTLWLPYCNRLQSANLHKALCAMPNLVALNITNCDRIGETVFNDLPNISPNLEILQMSCINASYDNIANLPKLRCLYLNCESFPVRNSFFQALVDKRSNLESLKIIESSDEISKQCELIGKLKKLKELHIPDNYFLDDNSLFEFCNLKDLVEIDLSWSEDITNMGLLELVRNCPKLEWVNVEETEITSDFAKALLPIINKRKRGNVRLTFLVWQSQMRRCDMPQEYHSEEVKSKVQFVFRQILENWTR